MLQTLRNTKDPKYVPLVPSHQPITKGMIVDALSKMTENAINGQFVEEKRNSTTVIEVAQAKPFMFTDKLGEHEIIVKRFFFDKRDRLIGVDKV